MSKIIILVGVILAGLFVFSKYRENPEPQVTEDPWSYEECLSLASTKKIDSYPKVCDSNGKIFWETVKEPIDTTAWETFDTKLGFKFKCPPHWDCQTLKDYPNSALIYALYNNTHFQLTKITPVTFPESNIRHRSYKTPVEWLTALKNKQELAVKTFPEAIKNVPGTDELLYPYYYNLKFTDVAVIKTENSEVVSIPDYAFVPINKTDLVLAFTPYKDPVIKAIINSIQE